MKLTLKILLTLTTVVSLGFGAVVLAGGFWLKKYADNSVNDELLDAHISSDKTEFYCFESIDGRKTSKAKKIDNASLDNGVKYKYTSYGSIPQDLINAFVAIEDKRFYRHNGIDPVRTGRAITNYFIGSGRFGGSTITQQLVKNITGHDEISVERKIKEAFAAIKIENDYEKSEILELYLNVINLSEGCRGVGAAAEFFFSKSPEDLTLPECATIAAITNNPSRYDPIKHPENNIERRNVVLECMLDQGYITKSEYSSAIKEPIKLNISNKTPKNVNSWYVDMVIEDVINDLCLKYDLTKNSAALMLYRGGYRIYTAMDDKMQGILDEYYSDEYNFPTDRNGNTAQSAMIIIDPYTGDILGVAGALGEKKGNRIQNYATQTKRPPGSTLKPLSVYAPAIDKGLINWSTQIEDSPVTNESDFTKGWPQNVDRTFSGSVDIKYAVEHSLNTVAVKVLDMIGAEESMRFLKDKLLFTSLDEKADIGPASLALGQPTKGVTLRELTGAYSVFEEGIMSKTRSYYKVTDKNGRIILDNSPSQEAAISKESAAIVTKLLEGVVDSGTASGKVTLDSSVSVAGKSGTSGNCCDRYFVGYTPELLAGVWFGYEYPQNLEDFGGNLSVYIWDDVMREIYDNCDLEGISEFSVPDTVQKLTYEKENSSDNGKTEYSLEIGWFNVTNHKTE